MRIPSLAAKLKWTVFVAFVLIVAMGVPVFLLSDDEVRTVIELSKEESLKVMDLEYRRVMATADRDEFIQFLYLKYGATSQTHNLNLAKGTLVPVEKVKPKENKNQ